ncbi:MAG TPA: phosphoribosylformylglycinamidine synthase subunit PurS [Casimicrobiaceae bacterium]
MIDVAAPDRGAADRSAREMCEKLLANPVTEDFEIATVEPA